MPNDELKSIPIDQLVPNPWNREHFPQHAMRELISSVRHLGILEPLIVRPAPESEQTRESDLPIYEIASGNRRWLAAREAGLTEVPCIVKNLTSEEVQDLNLVTNVQREDIPVLDRARMIRERMQSGNLTQEELAVKVGKERSWISKMLSVLDLAPAALENLSKVEVAFRPLLALRALTPEQQISLTQQVKDGALWPEEIERRVGEISGKRIKPAKEPRAPVPTPATAPAAVGSQPSETDRAPAVLKDVHVATIRRVMVGGQWIVIMPGSFEVHPYRYRVIEGVLHSGGDGFSCVQQGGTRLTGPMSSIELVATEEAN